MNIKNSIIISSILLFTTSALTKDILIGKTWDFAEKNAVDEITEYIENNKQKLEEQFKESREQNIKKLSNGYLPKDVAILPYCDSNETRLFDPTTFLETDIKDSKGTILYPKGLAINPLEYQNLHYEISVIDGNNSVQLNDFEKNQNDKIHAQLWITNGNAITLYNRFQRPVYIINESLKNRFGVGCVPSIITQEGNKLKIKEYSLDYTNRTNVDNNASRYITNLLRDKNSTGF